MVQFNTKDNEILVKIVYYGPSLSGKTTNLQKLHEMMAPNQITDLFSVNTMEDRTLFFDLLPVELGYVYGNSIKLQIYTVPGQVHYDSTRRIVLSGADGVVFIADSESGKLQDNVQSINNLYHNLQANRLNVKEVPLVIQYNKRDLEDAAPVRVLNQKLNFRNAPAFDAVAIEGRGVMETFLEAVKLTVRYIFQKYQLDKNIKNVDGIIDQLEGAIRNNAKTVVASAARLADAPPEAPAADAAARKPPKKEAGIPPSRGSTVLKYTHEFKEDDQTGSQEQLLKKAIVSNMETAELYAQLKKSQDALVQKNEEMQALYKQLRKTNNENLKIRRFLESLVNFAGEAIMTFNESWVIQNWNQAAEELFGYKRAEAINRNINMFFPKEAIVDLNRVISYVTNGKVVRGFETKLRNKVNALVPVSITFSPIKNQDNVIVAFAGIVRDLSFMAKMSNRLAAIQRFESVGSVLPDLVQQVLEQAGDLDAQTRFRLKAVLTLSKPLDNLTEPTDLNELINEALTLLQGRIEEQDVAMTIQLFPSLPKLLLDRQQALHALINVALNGLDSMAGRAKGKLTIGTHFGGGEVLLQVIDNGTGMAQDELSGAFDPSSDDRRSMRGLRLNTAKDLFKANHGAVRVDSMSGKGTKVTVRFPTS